MPFVLNCPTCRNSLSAHESPTPYVVNCPTCHQPLTVPAVASAPPPPEGEIPFDAPAPPSKRREKKPVSNTFSLYFFGVIAILIVAGVLFTQFRKADDREHADYERAVLLEQAYPTWRDRVTFSRQHGTKKDVDEAITELSKLEGEYASIIAKYPRWGKSALGR